MKTILALIFAVSATHHAHAVVCVSPEETTQAAQAIIDARAAGDISNEEYEARLRQLMPEECFGQPIDDPECDATCIDPEPGE